jgi:hypothetical protein
VPDPAFDPEDPPIETAPESGFDIGPKMEPSERMPLPEYAQHPSEATQVMFNVGDPVELDADPTGRGGTEAVAVHAVHVSGPPARMPARPMSDAERADYVAGQTAVNPYYPFRALRPGDVLIANGSEGTVEAISGDSVVVRVPVHNVTIRDEALRAREWRLQERLAEHHGGYSFGVLKENVVPLKLEEERVWADVEARKAQAGGSVVLGYKVMALSPDGSTLVSGADSRQNLPARAGEAVSMPGNGIYMSPNKQYVLDYYTSGPFDEDDPGREALVTFEFDPADVVWGNLTDREAEVGVATARIVDVTELWTDAVQAGYARTNESNRARPKTHSTGTRAVLLRRAGRVRRQESRDVGGQAPTERSARGAT